MNKGISTRIAYNGRPGRIRRLDSTNLSVCALSVSGNSLECFLMLQYKFYERFVFFAGILENSGVKLTPPSNEFRDFKTFTAKIFKKYAQQCGAVCVTPQGIPDYSLKIGELAKEKVCPHIQEYDQHSEGRLLLRLYIKVKVIIVMFSNNSVQGYF